MENIIEVLYEQTGNSQKSNKYGMREMQERAYEHRDKQYILLKSPPASGKSRALMFIALYKLHDQNIKKVIVAVPEKSIGGSFASTRLTENGFFADWEVNPDYNLCTSCSQSSKTKIFQEFLTNSERILICSHSTLRFAAEELPFSAFDNILLAIDEFHHASSDQENSVLGKLIHHLMEKSSVHIMAMTGTYFRGDAVPVLRSEDEEKFQHISYNYYDQLNGYKYLKSLGIGYHFYQGKYLSALPDVLDTDKKTIIHIPNVNSQESTKQKYDEVGHILDIIGTYEKTDENKIIHLRRYSDGKIIKVADLVEDEIRGRREKVQDFLRNISHKDDVDIIIALGMAKEGFDWPYCEHALTVGYRASLTEIIQIIGRATRDSEGKTHAQFTNLLVSPDMEKTEMPEINIAVNNMLKAISASLLMEQVLAPNWKFTPRFDDDFSKPEKGEIRIHGLKKPSPRVKEILESDLVELKANILQDEKIIRASAAEMNAEFVNNVLIPEKIAEKYPQLNDVEVQIVRDYFLADANIKKGEIIQEKGQQFIKMANKFVNIDELNIDLIRSINPFERAFEVLSKSFTPPVFRKIKDAIDMTRIDMTDEEAIFLYANKLQDFMKNHNREPLLESVNAEEKRLAECIIFLRNKYGQRN